MGESLGVAAVTRQSAWWRASLLMPAEMQVELESECTRESYRQTRGGLENDSVEDDDREKKMKRLSVVRRREEENEHKMEKSKRWRKACKVASTASVRHPLSRLDSAPNPAAIL
ncbi:unnamed protein product, partial [Mesorhabditis belari]|uniref:Uncharacterized protein n=1 Tax=Mesorhabditis belari TaxID=2138241 RepID=A0AAF3E907_9BILA